MTSDRLDKPPEPIHAGTERETLVQFLDMYRNALLRKGHGLDAVQLAQHLGPSSLTVGRLLRHMAMVEDHWFHTTFAGQEEREPWRSAPWDDDRDWEMTTADGMTFDELRHDFEVACARSRHIVDDADSLDLIAAVADHGRQVSLRWILVHMIEEYARHAGHADLLRESIDGQTGE